MSRFQKSALAATLALALGGCQDPVDLAAKKRIFSPEDPPQVVASAAEKLPPENVASDSRIGRRILNMDAAEVTERIGPHTYKATLSYEWAGPQGTVPVKLSETRTFRAGPGGVSGDFHGLLENSRNQGLELMRVGGKVYARSQYGTFRQRLRDRGIAERTRAELTGALRDMDGLFRHRIQLRESGTVTYEGRTAWRYTVALDPNDSADTSGLNLPPLLEPKGGRDGSTLRRQAFFTQRQPATLSGEVLVDAATSVVLKTRLDGRLSVPGSEHGGAADLRISLESALSEIGQDPKLQPPEDFLPDADKPQGIADALDRFGIPRTRDGAAKDAPAGAAEPEDEEG